jgi:hypothetical protein
MNAWLLYCHFEPASGPLLNHMVVAGEKSRRDSSAMNHGEISHPRQGALASYVFKRVRDDIGFP